MMEKEVFEKIINMWCADRNRIEAESNNLFDDSVIEQLRAEFPDVVFIEIGSRIAIQ